MTRKIMNKKTICNVIGNGVCVHCPRVPPKINGHLYGLMMTGRLLYKYENTYVINNDIPSYC